jgi:hypothetical protein
LTRAALFVFAVTYTAGHEHATGPGGGVARARSATPGGAGAERPGGPGFRRAVIDPTVVRKEDDVLHPVHREVHFWRDHLTEPPCGTLEDRFEWSDAVDDVTCEECLAALAGDGGRLGAATDDGERAGAEDQPPA